MQKSITAKDTYNHLLFLPNRYEASVHWPIILYLHGVGGKGDYLEVLKAHGLPKYLEEVEDFPFIVVSPQCPEEQDWSPALLGKLLDVLEEQYRVDTDRIYLTGIGAGATAAWQLAIEEPERFAAVAPICGGGDPHRACLLRDVPVWTFHGAKDLITPISETQSMVLALKLCGGNIAFTIYPESDHDVWTRTYNDPQFYSWLLDQRRSNYIEPVLDPVAEDLD